VTVKLQDKTLEIKWFFEKLWCKNDGEHGWRGFHRFSQILLIKIR